jgi:hypothetical protein
VSFCGDLEAFVVTHEKKELKTNKSSENNENIGLLI